MGLDYIRRYDPERKRHVTIRRYECRQCGAHDDIEALTTSGGRLPPEFLDKKIAQKGWQTGRHPGRALCADCAGRVPKVPKVIDRSLMLPLLPVASTAVAAPAPSGPVEIAGAAVIEVAMPPDIGPIRLVATAEQADKLRDAAREMKSTAAANARAARVKSEVEAVIQAVKAFGTWTTPTPLSRSLGTRNGETFNTFVKKTRQRLFSAVMAGEIQRKGQWFAPLECSDPLPATTGYRLSKGQVRALAALASKTRAPIITLQEINEAAQSPKDETMGTTMNGAGDGSTASLVEREGAINTARPATPADRRRIADALDQAYSIDKGKYLKDGSDQKIASSLNVPRVWVKDVREMLYGMGGGNEAAQISLDALSRLEARIGSVEDELLKLMAKVDEKSRALSDMRAEIVSIRSRLS